MTLEQLSNKIRMLILDNDEVTMPGIGTFVTEVVPAYFSDGGKVINPPSRRITFRKEQLSDTCLCDFDLSPVRKALATRKMAEMPGLGKLVLQSNGTVTFEVAKDIDIYPEGYGLKPITVQPLSLMKKLLSRY